MNKLGPLNDLFKTDTVAFTSPDGEVVPVKTNSLANPNPKKVAARKALDEARDALRKAEETYREVSKADEANRIKMLDDFYRDKWVLEYDRMPMMIGEGPVIKENFTITKVDKVTGIGYGFVSVKGKMLTIAERDNHSVPGDGKRLSIGSKIGDNLKISRVDDVLTANQLDKLLDKVRKIFFDKLGSIW